MNIPTKSQPSAAVTHHLACRLARRWVRVYTAALATDVGDGRRAEIESDLWEHIADAHVRQEHRISTQLDVLARVLIGLPSDLTWFSQARRTMKENGSMANTPESTLKAVSPRLAVAIPAGLVVVLALTLGMFGGYPTLILMALLVFFAARAVRARRASQPQAHPMTVPNIRARHRRLLAIAIVSAVVMVCDIIAMNLNVAKEASGEWVWLLLVPIGLFAPAIVGATAAVLLVSDWRATRAQA